MKFGIKQKRKQSKNVTAKNVAGNPYSSGATKSDKYKPTRLTKVFEDAREGRAGRAGSEKESGEIRIPTTAGVWTRAPMIGK